MRHTPAQTPEHETERSLRSTLPVVGLLLLLGAMGLGGNVPAQGQAPKAPAQAPVVPPGLTPPPAPGPPPELRQAAKQCKKDSDCPGAQVCRSSTCCLPAATPASTPPPPPAAKPKPYTVAEVKWSALP